MTTGQPTVEHPAHVVERLVFTGRGGEYFRIWVVSLLLTVLTLGVYSAWAKVRKVRYVRNNTRLAGHVFDYHANPAAILRGRLVGLALLTAYTWGFYFSAMATVVSVALLCTIGPWLFRSAQQFALANTSFRGLRFGFHSSTGRAYWVTLPVIALWLLPAVAPDPVSDRHGLVAALVPVLALPWMHHRVKAYQHAHASYGELRFAFRDALLRFYTVYATGACLMLAGGVLGATCALVAEFQSHGVATGEMTGVSTIVMGGATVLFIYVVVWPYMAARLQQVVWSRTRLESVRFGTDIRVFPLVRLAFRNAVLMILTCGLYWPWAVVALVRYRIGCIQVQTEVPLSSLAAGVRAAPVSAMGQGVADAFALDIGL